MSTVSAPGSQEAHSLLYAVAAAEKRAKQRRFCEEADCNGFSYRVGDSAYVVMKDNPSREECELEVCEVCEKTSKKRGRREVPMLECDQCLRGYHLDCLDPPLQAVPEVGLYIAKERSPWPSWLYSCTCCTKTL